MEVITSDNLIEVLKNELVVIHYSAKWCKPCKSMDSELKHLEKQFSSIVFGKVDVEKEKDLASSSVVLSLPSILIFKYGKEVERFSDIPEGILAMELSTKLGELL